MYLYCIVLSTILSCKARLQLKTICNFLKYQKQGRLIICIKSNIQFTSGSSSLPKSKHVHVLGYI